LAIFAIREALTTAALDLARGVTDGNAAPGVAVLRPYEENCSDFIG
jgi:hypothetical protein